MDTPPDAGARRRDALAEMTEICLTAARAVQARLLAAETDSACAEQALALQRLARAVRQTVFLGERLEIEAAKAQARADELAREAVDRAVRRRRAQVAARVAQAVHAQVERDRADELLDTREELLDEAEVFEAFVTEDIDVQVVRLLRDLGLEPPAESEAVAEDAGDAAHRRYAGDNLAPATGAFSDSAVEACFTPPRPAWNSS